MGGEHCSLPNCTASISYCKGLTFHKIPKKGLNAAKDEWREKLLLKINREDQWFTEERNKTDANIFICSRHFKPDCFKTGNSVSGSKPKRYLIPDSLPTEFMPAESVEVPMLPERKAPVLPGTQREDLKTDQQTVQKKNRVWRRKIATFETHNKSCGAEDLQTIFFQKHLALPASSVPLHDYDSPVDSSMVADSTDNQGAVGKEANSTLTVTQQSQQQPIRRRTCSQRQSELIRRNATSETVIRPRQQYVRRKETRSQSKLSSQDGDQTDTGTSANSRHESTEPELMSHVKIEIDIAEDRTDFLRDSSPSSAQYYHRSTMPCVQLIKMEPEDESNCHSTQCKEEAATNRLHVNKKFKTEVKQEKDDSLSSCHTPFSNKQFHMSHNAMEIKQEIDMDVCGHSEDVSTGRYNADGFRMEIQKKRKVKDISEHKEASERFHTSNMHTQIKQEKSVDERSCCEFFNSDVCDCEIDNKIKKEEDVDFYSSSEAFTTGRFHSFTLGMEIKQEKDLVF